MFKMSMRELRLRLTPMGRAPGKFSLQELAGPLAETEFCPRAPVGALYHRGESPLQVNLNSLKSTVTALS